MRITHLQKGFTIVEIILLIILAVLVAGLGWYTINRSLSTNTHGLAVERVSSGGLAGRGDGKNFTIRGAELRSGDKTFTLSSDQITIILNYIQQADFFHITEAFHCNCADQYTTKWTISLDGTTRTVIIDDGADLPPALDTLQNYLNSLAVK